MPRIDYHDDPAAPPANSLVPAASAVVADEQGRILLHRRSDKTAGRCLAGRWSWGRASPGAPCGRPWRETARVVAGAPRVSEESTEVAWFRPEAIAGLPMVEAMRLRILDFLGAGRRSSAEPPAGYLPAPSVSLCSRHGSSDF